MKENLEHQDKLVQMLSIELVFILQTQIGMAIGKVVWQ